METPSSSLKKVGRCVLTLRQVEANGTARCRKRVVFPKQDFEVALVDEFIDSLELYGGSTGFKAFRLDPCAPWIKRSEKFDDKSRLELLDKRMVDVLVGDDEVVPTTTSVDRSSQKIGEEVKSTDAKEIPADECSKQSLVVHNERKGTIVPKTTKKSVASAKKAVLPTPKATHRRATSQSLSDAQCTPSRQSFLRNTASSGKKRQSQSFNLRDDNKVRSFNTCLRGGKDALPRSTAQHAPIPAAQDVDLRRRKLGGGASTQRAERALYQNRIKTLEKELEQKNAQLAAGVGLPGTVSISNGAIQQKAPTLKELESALKEATKRVMAGDAKASDDAEMYSRLVSEHPDFKLRLKEEAQAWEKNQAEANTAALETLRRLIPPDVTTASIQSLEDSGLPSALAKRIMKKRALWLIRLPPKRIQQLHPTEYRRYDPSGLDVLELRAIYTALPVNFLNDADGKKAQYRSDIRERLVVALKQSSINRNPAYSEVSDQGYFDPSPPLDNDNHTEALVRSGVDDTAGRENELAAVMEQRRAARSPLGENNSISVPVLRQRTAKKFQSDDPRTAMVASLPFLSQLQQAKSESSNDAELPFLQQIKQAKAKTKAISPSLASSSLPFLAQLQQASASRAAASSSVVDELPKDTV